MDEWLKLPVLEASDLGSILSNQHYIESSMLIFFPLQRNRL